jgi:hypothetical protein
MILHCLDVIHLAPDLRNADAEVGGQVIESHLFELKSGVGNGLQGGSQCLEVAAQDVRPWWMLWGGLVDCRPYVEPRHLHDTGHMPGYVRREEPSFVGVDAFHTLIRRKKEAALDGWLDMAAVSLVAPFARDLARDHDAVRAAISSAWSNAQTEGQINKLKLVKRQMYGRGNLDLLQARVIAAGR